MQRRADSKQTTESILWIQTARPPRRKNGRSVEWERLRSQFQNPSAKPTNYANHGLRTGAGRAECPWVRRLRQGRLRGRPRGTLRNPYNAILSYLFAARRQ
jgi:hypothetical protein